MKWLVLLLFGAMSVGCATSQKEEGLAMQMAPGSPGMAH